MKLFIVLILTGCLVACSTQPKLPHNNENIPSKSKLTRSLNLHLCPMKVTNAPVAIDGQVLRDSAFACLKGVSLLVNPAPGSCLSSGFGIQSRTHRGVDYHKRPAGRVVSAADGVIHSIDYRKKDFGHWVIVDHGNAVYTAYAHLAEVNPTLRVGKSVKQGDYLATMGNTGNATGIHLHFEIRTGDINTSKSWWGLRPINPFSLSADCP